MSDFWSWAGRRIAETQQTLEQAAQAAQQAVQEATAAVTGQPATPPLDPTTLPDAQRAAFYGALFAMAAADGSIDKDEIQLIFQLIDLDGMAEGSRRTVQSYIIQPPRLLDTLQALEHGDDTLRYGVMVNLVDVAWANDVIAPEQRYALDVAAQRLCISAEQVAAIEAFIHKLKTIRERGLDDNYAAEATKQAAAGLAAVGVPIAAVYLSGSVIGLSAAGITSGLAALGLGLGMVPGIGIAIVLGTGIYLGVSYLLDSGGKREKERIRAEVARKAQLVIQNLQQTINLLIDRVQQLEQAAADVATNRAAIHELNERLRALQQLLAKRQRQADAAP
jgi:uncharacterized membrane protein YebE (DUF533 family)